MKVYEKPEVAVLNLEVEDVIATSNLTTDPDEGPVV